MPNDYRTRNFPAPLSRADLQNILFALDFTVIFASRLLPDMAGSERERMIRNTQAHIETLCKTAEKETRQ